MYNPTGTLLENCGPSLEFWLESAPHTGIPTGTASNTMQQHNTPHTRGVDAPDRGINAPTHQPIQPAKQRNLATCRTNNPPFDQPATPTKHTMQRGVVVVAMAAHTGCVRTHTHTHTHTWTHTLSHHGTPPNTTRHVAAACPRPEPPVNHMAGACPRPKQPVNNLARASPRPQPPNGNLARACQICPRPQPLHSKNEIVCSSVRRGHPGACQREDALGGRAKWCEAQGVYSKAKLAIGPCKCAGTKFGATNEFFC